MCKMNLASIVFLYSLLGVNINLATHCATKNGAMIYKKKVHFKCFSQVWFKKTLSLLLRYLMEHWFYFILKQFEKPGQSSEKLSPGTVPVPPEV